MARRPEASDELWHDIASPDKGISEAAFEEVVMHYQYLVEAIARKLQSGLPTYIEDPELLSMGQVGLLKAMHRYDVERGDFSKYASTVIWGAIIDGLRALDFAPSGLRKQQRELEAAIELLRDEQGEDPEIVDIAIAMNMPEEDVRDLQHRILRADVSPTDPVIMPPAKAQETSGSEMWSREICREFVTWLQKWDRETQEVVILKYWKNLSLKAIGHELDLPVTYVRERHHAVLAELLPFMTTLADDR